MSGSLSSAVVCCENSVMGFIACMTCFPKSSYRLVKPKWGVSQLSENTQWQLDEWNEPQRSHGKLFGTIAKGYGVHVVSLLCGDGILERTGCRCKCLPAAGRWSGPSRASPQHPSSQGRSGCQSHWSNAGQSCKMSVKRCESPGKDERTLC